MDDKCSTSIALESEIVHLMDVLFVISEHENAEITESDREHQERFHEIVLEHQPYM